MNDQNDPRADNPLTKSDSPWTYEEAYYNDDEAMALYDTYSMLRDYGFSIDDLIPLMFAIEKLTIYGADDPEGLRLRLQYEGAMNEFNSNDE